MDHLETRQLRYFVAVAEEQHFGRAAHRLGMAQPPLSRAIRDLERHLGVQLLVRTSRRVALTPAGQVLLDEARIALDAVATAGNRTRHAGQEVPALRLALKADHDAGLLPRILDAYDVLPVELLLGGYGEQLAALHDGRADVALLTTPFDERGIDSEPLVTGPRLVAMAASDPLAARTGLRLVDLTGRLLPYGTPAEKGLPTPPFDHHEPLDHSQIFSLIEVGAAVWFLPVWLAERFDRPGIAYRPVEGLEPATLTVAWPARSRLAAVATFVRTVQQIAGDTATYDNPAPVGHPV
ncbi:MULTISPECIES: LysR family transcriptional regulator [Actinoplanes]|uniref:LysR family transcriptional regulator n=2 Tax=Actinoplanes TaxID=1865 RepID=A0A124G9P3_9ACTN|nr:MULTISPECIES: LysR family transcriptional regulator [Actinoplanes]KUL29727.1 LysR family transcriptional regulator [Actinoplanes awajinensis subsp. mycoplanecinus]GIE72898.1 LysR family transcriptional regulator [Actinoplanes palleronii]